MGGKLPLVYYNLLNDDLARREESKEKDYERPIGVVQDVTNPNSINRPLAWPLRIKSSISPGCDQEEIIDVMITALEKFHWDGMEIAHWIKVKLTCSIFNLDTK